MDEIIQIKCPFDGAVLSVKNQPGIENKNVTCPICKNKYPFSQFRRVTQNPGYEDPATHYPGSNEHATGIFDNHTRYAHDEKTQVGDLPNFTLGKVSVVGRGQSFQLRPGRNVIGRKAQKSEADFKIDTADKRSMSREHIIIDVKKVPGKGFVHYLSLYKEKVNSTYLGNEQLFYGDCIVINHGDIIKLPDATLRFEIPDDEATQL